jgi:uncharacterized protein (DUF58 family)
LLLSLIAVLLPAIAAFVWLADFALIFMLGVDFLMTPPPDQLDVRRRIPRRVGLDREFDRALWIGPGIADGLTISMHEERAPELECSEPGNTSRDGEDPQVALLPEGKPLVLTRKHAGRVRGRFAFGDLRVRLRGPLGLIWRQATVEAHQDLDVEPAMLGLNNVLKLAASERWFDLGVRRMRRRGGQREFDSLREYVPGDDPRQVDQKAFARRGTPIVKQYIEERGQELLILIDTGRRMGATTSVGSARGWSKLDHALDAALQLSAVALQSQDRVGIALFDERLHEYLPAEKGMRHFERLRRSVYAAQPSKLESDLSRALRELSGHHSRRALVLVLSEVADPYEAPRQRAALSSGSKRHRLMFASLDDPAIRRAASGIDPVRPAERVAALSLREERRHSLAELSGSKARILDTLPAESAGRLLAAWLDERRR